jgi:hypothetical protein
MKRTSGPITVEIKEGMVTVARFLFEDTRTALLDDWPERVQEALERIERASPVGRNRESEAE